MTTIEDRRVARLIAIIGREKAQVDMIKQAVRELEKEKRHDELLGLRGDWYKPSTTKEKKAAKSLVLAFEKFEKLLDRRDMDVVFRRTLHGESERNEFAEWKAKLSHWRDCVQAFAKWPLGQPKPSKAKFVRKHKAAEVAAALLDSHGLKPTVTYRPSNRTMSTFCRVAAVLYGDEKENLSHQCRSISKRETGVPNNPT